MENRDTGLLLDKANIELYRAWFNQMVELLGINVLYRAPRKKDKTYDLHGELDTLYCEPIMVGSVFEEYTNQKTMKKLGWNAERDETHPTIQVAYDVPGLESGGLFIIPSGLDNAEGRVFKILDMHTAPVFPFCVVCKLGPVLKSDFERSQLTDFTHTDFNVLNDEDDEEEETDEW